MYKLNESSINSPFNARSILLSSAYIRANLIQMDEMSTEALRLILQTSEALGDVKVSDGKNYLIELLNIKMKIKQHSKTKEML